MTPKAVDKAALALPGASVSLPRRYVQLVYKLGGKMFAAISSGKAPSLSVKVSEVACEMLIEREGIIPAPYLARTKWVQLVKLKAMDDVKLRERLAEAYRIVVAKLPKKLRPVV